jgi:hypothetical protein
MRLTEPKPASCCCSERPVELRSGVISERLAKSVDETVGMVPNPVSKNTQSMLIGRIEKRLAVTVKIETRRLDFSARDSWLDAVLGVCNVLW